MNAVSKTVLLMLALGAAIGAGFLLGRRHAPIDEAPTAATSSDERRVLYWYDPMVPDQHFDKPGKSPFMDMMLVPRYADEVRKDGVQIDPGLRQALGVRTARVELAPVQETLRAPGTLQWNARAQLALSARAAGIVERLHVRAPYTRVEQGQPLGTLRSPALSAALAEYQALERAHSAEAKSLREAARARLLQLGLGDADLRAGHSGIVVRAPAAAVVLDVAVREGESVEAGQLLFQLNTSETLWLEARLPQAVAGRLQPGAAVEVHVDAVPGSSFAATLETLLPDVDPATRTQAARIVLDQADPRLAAGQFAEVVLYPPAAEPRPLLPSEALILTGRDARVIVQDEDGGFRPVRVRTGRQVGERLEILDGLEGGETVVVSGQFLIDSEASLSGALSRLGAVEASGEPTDSDATADEPTDHGHHTHGDAQ